MNIRSIATPLTIGGFILMAVTGVLMFFHKEIGLNKEAHEWFSWAFLAGAGLHIFTNFTAFKRYFKPSIGLGIIAALGIVLAGSFFLKEEKKGPRPDAMVMQTIESAPIKNIAALTGQSSQTIVSKLASEGIIANSENATLNEIIGENREAKFKAINVIFGTPPTK